MGMKDFGSFTADDPEEKSTKVLIDGIELKQAGELILIRITGSHFLWKMVRQMVGVLAEVGRGDLDPSKVADLLGGKSDLPAKLTAPPSGLFLERVYYDGDARNLPLTPVLEVGRGV
jgi:tRNA pseudouridine38-40 synthase